ncbi:alpha/beta fold hydrolase [Chelativorans sp. YIM 93263]|uniref:alpha/beta fold hydrolase n=1 Tax=Chelativorans sp. YIM 93263 TaxID=2906648 RepID=UPI0023781ECA|nr:alpha/beta hydrolase [Chelativorans sp. YIM 93263]
MQTVSRRIAHYVKGEGPDVLFVHGNASTHEVWSHVVRDLAVDYRCISYDLRGHGASSKEYDKLTLDLLVDDLEQLRNELSLRECFLVGHSLGALIAAEYAYRFPDRVRKLCMIAAPARRDEKAKSAGKQLLRQLSADGVGKVLPGLVKRWYTNAFVAAHPGSLEARLEQLNSIEDRVFIDAYSLYLETDISPKLPHLRMPGLVMTGEHSSGSDARVARYIADAMPDSSLTVFREMKNGILTEIPDRVSKELARFLRK